MIQFGAIWFFILLPLPWLVQRFFPPAPRQEKSALKVPFFSELQTLQGEAKNNIAVTKSWRKWIVYCIWFLLLLTFSNPQWLGEPIDVMQKGRDIMLAVDISGSMQIPDMRIENEAVDRLTALKKVASNFINERAGDRLGLVLFGTRAYLQTPLTFDRQTVKAMLDDASIGLAGPQTALGDAIALAIKRMKSSTTADRILILLTDGANNSGELSPIDAAALAAKANIRIYTIGFGADELAIRGFFSTQTINPSADLDEKTLEKIAQDTHGKYFRAKDTEQLQEIYAAINKLEPVNVGQVSYRPVTWLYIWPLTLALLLSLYFPLRHQKISRLAVLSVVVNLINCFKWPRKIKLWK